MNGNSVDTPSVDINTGLSESRLGQSIIYLQHMKMEGREGTSFSKHSTSGFDFIDFTGGVQRSGGCPSSSYKIKHHSFSWST